MRIGFGRRLVWWSISAAALVVLILLPATASGGQETSSAPKVTLTVSIAGTGTGWVHGSESPGNEGDISCAKLGDAPTTCSAQFTANMHAYLFAVAADGSTFAGWSAAPPPYVCSGLIGPGNRNSCDILLSDPPGNPTVQATFNLKPPPCIAPSVKGRTLAKAKAQIKEGHCGVGKVTRAFSSKVKKGRVISQNPVAHWRNAPGSKINLIVSKGRR